MRLLKRISGLFFSFCLIGSMTLPAMAAEKAAASRTQAISSSSISSVAPITRWWVHRPR